MQTFETTNWDEDSKKLAEIVGVDESEWVDIDGEKHIILHRSDDMRFALTYTNKYRMYYVDNIHNFTSVQISWSGEVLRTSKNKALADELAKMLFHLNVLSDAIELALGTRVTGHQKMNWTLELEERLKGVAP